MCRPQESASKPTRNPRFAARSPSSWKSAAALSIPASESGETLLQIIRRSQPSCSMTSNLRSARAKALDRCGSGIPSKSRKGWKVIVPSPRSSIMRRASAGVPLNDKRSFSKISTPLNCAAAIASIFSASVPLRQTVAMAVRMLVGSVSVEYQEALLVLPLLADGPSGERVLDTARHVAGQHFAGFDSISVQRAFQQLRMLARSDFATVAQCDHLIPQVLVKNRRVVVDQHLRSARGNEGLMELPIISLPFLR